MSERSILMTVRYPEAAQQHKALLQLLVLEILKNYTDPGNPITKQKIIEKATELCGFEPARNTIYDDIDALIDAGFPIEQSRKGVYYDGSRDAFTVCYTTCHEDAFKTRQLVEYMDNRIGFRLVLVPQN